MAKITLTPLAEEDREQFILDNQRAFKYGAMEEFGERDNHFEEDGEIISRKTIEDSIDSGVAYRIRRRRSGKPAHRILRQGISISMSTNVGSISSNSSTAIIRIRMILRPDR